MAIPNTIVQLKIKDASTGATSDPISFGIDFNNETIQEAISDAVVKAVDQVAIPLDDINSLFQKN